MGRVAGDGLGTFRPPAVPLAAAGGSGVLVSAYLESSVTAATGFPGCCSLPCPTGTPAGPPEPATATMGHRCGSPGQGGRGRGRRARGSQGGDPATRAAGGG